MPCLEGGLHRLKADPSARADDEDRRHGFMLHGRTRLAHHHVRCRQPHRKIGERLADKAAHALPASGAAGAPAATRAPAATGAHRSSQRATGANASLDPLEFWSVGRQPRLTASAISSGVAFVWIRTVRTDFTGGATGATAEVTGALAATGAPAATGATSNKQVYVTGNLGAESGQGFTRTDRHVSAV